VLLDQDGPLQRALAELALRVVVGVLGRGGAALLLDADEHLAEQEALEILPRLAVPAHAHRPVQAQLAEPARAR
jgi:hypothetical protein